MTKYQAVKKSKTLKQDVRGLQYAVHTWGKPEAKPLFLLHGWADTGRSFQFVADALSDEWFIIAPDWRGFGDSQWNLQGYWFPDYLADLDTLVDRYSPDKQARLVGHSMGGNVACLYAGSRPDRVSHLVSMDVFGLPETSPEDAPIRYEKWLDQIKKPSSFSNYNDLEQLIEHINKLAPGISTARAEFIAETWCKVSIDGKKYKIKADPAHKRVNPILYRREEARACWNKIAARTLLIFGQDSRFCKSYYEEGYKEECSECFSDLTEKIIAGAGHMVHMQQAEKVGEILQEFLDK
ncbi:MAG: pimeloyl-ACP methyl ester carboxylesterase [Gammaproteobacteria bacterium]|jgi:pimeloyl-ACP methyl ester carboxylesterase